MSNYCISSFIYAIRSVWEYFKPAWEGEDGKPSYKRAGQFVFMALISKIVYVGFTNIYQIYALLILTLTFLLLAMVISAPQIIEALQLMFEAKSKINKPE
jgi:hypothetical protein